jgi:hypothetical protein
VSGPDDEQDVIPETTDAQYLDAARARCSDGVMEVDDNATVSRPDEDGDDGAYVQVWLWISGDDARTPKEASLPTD